MAVFLIVSEKTNPTLGTRIAEVYPDDLYKVGEDQWLVASDKPSKDVAESLKIHEGEFGRVVVFKVDSYYGWHSKSLWEWLALKSATK